MLHDDLHPDTGEPVPGLQMPIRGIGWSRTTVFLPVDETEPFQGYHLDYEPDQLREADGISYMLYVTQEDWKHYYAKSHEELLGRPVEAEFMEGAIQLRVWLSDMSGWSFGAPWGTPGEGTQVEVPYYVAERRKWLLTYFRWTWQRILDSGIHYPNRTERKLGVRFKKPIQDGYIKVVRLRRKDRQGGDDSEFKGNLDHRFVVRGHWRRQWYRSLGPARNEDGSFNDESHRLVWVSPFVKGPESGPLVLGHNVSASVR
jgi:hypothetical protein